jgi:hypothetical protein
MVSDAAGQAVPSPNASLKRETDLELKRARDRKSQQAMRNRAKWNIHNLTEQTKVLTKNLEEQVRHTSQLNQRLEHLELENETLKAHNAALRLSLLRDPSTNGCGLDCGSARVPVWKLPPNNIAPSCVSDSILQDWVHNRRERRASIHSNGPGPTTPGSLDVPSYPLKPNFCALIDKELRSDDEISNIVGAIIRSYADVETLPKQVAAAYVMTSVLRWEVLLDEISWNQMPEWLRPTHTQRTTPHAAWVDRMPWPKMRDYLVAHPEITLDDLSAVYGSSFRIRWQHDPAHVLITVDEQSKAVITNPIFEDHIRHLENWALGERFRKRFPEISELIGEEASAT